MITTPDPVLNAFELSLRAQDLATSTIHGYCMDVSFFANWLSIEHGGVCLGWSRVTHGDVQAYRQHLVGVLRQKGTAVNRRIQSLRRFFAWAMQTGYAETDPAQEVKFMRVEIRMQPAALRESEVHAMLRVTGQSTQGLAKRNYALVQLLLQSGIRVGELAALKVSDFTLYERSGWVRVVDGKGRRQREVPLNATARRAMAAYLATRPELQPSDCAFLSLRQKPPSIRSIQKLITSLARRAKLTRIRVTPHTLRHTFASSFLKDNPGKLVELASLLGHESLDTTAVYTKASRESLAEDVERSRFNVPG